MLTCKEASQLVSGSLDRRLRLPERLALRVHLMICDACARFAAQARFLRRAARLAGDDGQMLPEIRLPPAARERLAQTLRRQ